MSRLSNDALIFGLSFLSGPQSILTFGGISTERQITPRARAALSELVEHGYAKRIPVSPPIEKRESYSGVQNATPISQLFSQAGLDPFDELNLWVSFEQASSTKWLAGVSMPSL